MPDVHGRSVGRRLFPMRPPETTDVIASRILAVWDSYAIGLISSDERRREEDRLWFDATRLGIAGDVVKALADAEPLD